MEEEPTRYCPGELNVYQNKQPQTEEKKTEIYEIFFFPISTSRTRPIKKFLTNS